jgi:hypothetical protein
MAITSSSSLIPFLLLQFLRFLRVRVDALPLCSDEDNAQACVEILVRITTNEDIQV